jgi:phenylalanyl-tRNA synthetase alpha subunit
MLSHLFFSYSFSEKQRHCLILFTSLVFLSVTETKNIHQTLQQLHSAQKKYADTKALVSQQKQRIAQTHEALRKQKKSTDFIDSAECIKRLITRTQTAQLAPQITEQKTNQYSIAIQANTEVWQKFFSTLNETLQTCATPIKININKSDQENIETAEIVFSILDSEKNDHHNRLKENTIIAPNTAWVGILAKDKQSWVFLKQADQTLLGLTTNEYLPNTHWKIRAVKPTHIILENDFSHTQTVQGLF